MTVQAVTPQVPPATGGVIVLQGWRNGPAAVVRHGGKLRGTRHQFPSARHDVPANRVQYSLLDAAHAVEAFVA
jgi:hypothetical protein